MPLKGTLQFLAKSPVNEFVPPEIRTGKLLNILSFCFISLFIKSAIETGAPETPDTSRHPQINAALRKMMDRHDEALRKLEASQRNPNDKKSHIECQKMYEEQIRWAKEAGVDFIVAETINWTGEMEIALKAIKQEGLIAVANFAIPKGDLTREGHTPEDACKMMEDQGADVVGLNCYRGPEMTMKLIKKIRDKVSCHVAALPVPYRTSEEYPGFLNQPKDTVDPDCKCIPGDNIFPVALDHLYCNRFEMAEFAKDCLKQNINFIGICCGAEAHHVREMAVAVGKKPIAMKYMPDMSKHFHHGTDKTLKDVNKEIKY